MQRRDSMSSAGVHFRLLAVLVAVCGLLTGCEELGIETDGESEQQESAGTPTAETGQIPDPPPLNLPPMEGSGNTNPESMSPAGFADYFRSLAPNLITDDDLIRASQNQQLTAELSELDLRAAPVTAKGVSALRQLPQLRQLNLAGSVLQPDGWNALGQVTQLEVLDLESAGVSDTTLGFLEQLTELRSLSLKNCNLTDIPFRHLKNLSKLEELDVNGIRQFTGAGMEALGPAGARAPLRILRATGTKFGVFGFEHIGRLNTLEEFAAGAAGVTDAGLAELKGNSNLRVLHVGGNSLSDAGLRSIGAFKALEDLDVSGHRLVSDASLRRMRALKALRILNLEGTSCTPDGIKALKGALPDCRIRFGGTEY